MAFDFGKLLADPTFQFGTSLLLNGRQPNAVPQAFGALQQAAALKQERELQQQRMLMQQQQMAQQAEQAQMEAAYREATIRNYERVDERERLKLQIDQANLERQNRQLEMEAAQEARRRAMQEKFLNQIGNSGMFGPSLPSSETLNEGGETPAPPQPPSPQRGPVPLGRFGTPTRLLDNLEQVESSGNPNARGPAVPSHGGDRAEGSYQFMPSTRKMLREKHGIEFDPYNREEARNAADFYLAQLARQNNGDWGKALAAYGGFVTKDPSSYVSRVLQGISPPPAAATGAQATPSPNRGLELARLGAAGAMAGIKGADQLVELGKMMEPKHVPAGGYQRAPDGTMTFVGDPYQERSQEREDKKLALDSWKAVNPSSQVMQSDTGPLAFNPVTKKVEPITDQRGQQVRPDALSNRSKVEAANAATSRMLATVSETMNHPGLAWGTGVTGTVARRIPGTPAYDFAAQIDALKSQQSLEALKELKEAGVSLGQVSNAEGERLERQIANLDPKQSPAQLKKELGKIRDSLASMQSRVVRGYNNRYPETAIPTAPAKPTNGSGKIKFLGFE